MSNISESVGRISIAAFGVRIGIRVNDEVVLRRVHDHLPPGHILVDGDDDDCSYSIWKDWSQHSELYSLYARDEPISATESLEEILEQLESRLHFDVATRARGKLFIHAGVVGWRNAALVMPGRSFTGKTCLVAALVRDGASYYSDEYAVLDLSGRVHAYPRALRLRSKSPGWGPARTVLEAIHDPGKLTPLPIGLVLVSQYQRGAPWRPRSLSSGQALLRLLDNTLTARQDPELALSTLAAGISGSGAVTSARGDAVTVAAKILSSMDAVLDAG